MRGQQKKRVRGEHLTGKKRDCWVGSSLLQICTGSVFLKDHGEESHLKKSMQIKKKGSYHWGS